jgi:hypothetical protein
VQIFVSYSRQNADLIQSLVEDIEALGHDVWYDHEISGGQAWWDQILTRIRGCDVFVFALSPYSLDSRPCRLECSYAFKLNKNILPVLVADGVASATLPEELSVIQFINYRQPDKQAALTLGRSLASLPPSPPLPTQLPEPPAVPVAYLGRLKDRVETEEVLSFQEQAALVLELKQHLEQNVDKRDVPNLLRRMRRRDDLYAKIADEIDSLLASAEPAAPPPPVPEVSKPQPKPQEPKPPSTPISSTAQSVSPKIKPAGFWRIVIPFVIVGLTISVIMAQSHCIPAGDCGYHLMEILSPAVIFLPIALFLWLYFRGTQIVLSVQNQKDFTEKLKVAMPRRFKLISETADMLIFKWFVMPPGWKRLNRIFVQFDQNSATITGPARFVNRIQAQMNV